MDAGHETHRNAVMNQKKEKSDDFMWFAAKPCGQNSWRPENTTGWKRTRTKTRDG
jgi:hypothetical protein